MSEDEKQSSQLAGELEQAIGKQYEENEKVLQQLSDEELEVAAGGATTVLTDVLRISVTTLATSVVISATVSIPITVNRSKSH